jgi:nitrogen fixation NifU-like protein
MPDDALYREEILDHYFNSAHRGRLERADLSAEMDNPLCGDHIRLELELDPQRRGIAQAAFDGHGCAISQASASLLSERLEGTSLEEARGLTEADALGLLAMSLTPARRKCGLLAWRALRRALADAPPAAGPPAACADGGCH